MIHGRLRAALLFMVFYLHNALSQPIFATPLDTGSSPYLTWRLIASAPVIPCYVPDDTYTLRIVTTTKTNSFSLTGLGDHASLVVHETPSGNLGLQSISRVREVGGLETAATLKIIYGGVFLLVGLLIARCYQSSGRR